MSPVVPAGSETVSVVCAVTSADAPLEEFHKRTKAAMQSISPSVDFEILFVDDSTEDGVLEVLADLADQDAHVGVIRLSRSFGRETAVVAGVDHAEGDAVVLIDPYLQDPPQVIAEMVAKWREGWDVVAAERVDGPADFRLMSRRVVDTLRETDDENRYSRALVAWSGFPRFALAYEHDAQRPGPQKTFNVLGKALSGATQLSDKPLKLATTLGLFVTAAAFLAGLFLAVRKIIDPSNGTAGYASMMTVILFLGGIQLLTIGILGQYLGRTYTEVKRRPLYVVAARYNVDVDSEITDLTETVLALPSVAASPGEPR